MSSSNPVVVGIDFSPASANTLHEAARIATVRKATLVVVHVMDASRVSHWLGSNRGAGEAERLQQQAEEKLADFVKKEAPGVEVRLVATTGRPSEVLQETIDRENADLLVIAANDTTRKRLGSTASRCVRTAHCDVLVLRDWQDKTFSKVVACVDLSAATATIVDRTAEFAKLGEPEVDFVTVIFPPGRDLWGETIASTPTDQDYHEACLTKARTSLEHALEPAAEVLSGVNYTTNVIEAADPAIRLTHYFAEVEADLVILGTRGHSKLGAFFIGTNTERLLHDSPVSVLAVRV